MEPIYKTWRDRANNIGVQCLVCNQTRWPGLESTIDPATGQNCANCVLIRDTNTIATLNATKETLLESPTPPEPSQPPQYDDNWNDIGIA